MSFILNLYYVSISDYCYFMEYVCRLCMHYRLLYTYKKLSRLKSTSLRWAVEQNKTYLIGTDVLCPAEVKPTAT